MERLDELGDLVSRGSVVVLTGAGISTDSGIPDYRGPGKQVRTPMTFADFVSGPVAQQRYWARSYVGWQAIGRADPNAGHLALAQLERTGLVSGLITQNVDGLHSSAGSNGVIDLHGRIADVVCLSCREVSPRVDLQRRLDELNPAFADRTAMVTPDGDAAVDEVSDFVLVPCTGCGGPLKPDVVFFGENVPRPRVERCIDLVDRASCLLVAGSSLTVLSGFRFVKQAKRNGTPVVIVNRGPTRGDGHADVRFDAGCSQTLAGLVAAFGA